MGFSLGGGTACFLFCKVGQVAWDGSSNVYLASYDQPKGNGVTFPGIWRAQPDPVTGEILNAQQLVPNAGLAGDLTTAVAVGPDGNLYVGFLKNGNVKRIVAPTGSNPIVQSVGVSPNGRPLRALVFVGSGLYLASKDSLSVIRNAVATSCQLADEKRLGGFESRYRSFARNRGKVIKEFRQSLASFQIVEQSLERNACSPEHWRTSKDIWILHDDLVDRLHSPILRPNTLK